MPRMICMARLLRTDPKPVAILLASVLALTACVHGGATRCPTDDSLQLERNTEFDGATLRLFVTQDDGTELSVNTTDDVFEALPGRTPMPGHQAQAWTFLKITGPIRRSPTPC